MVPRFARLLVVLPLLALVAAPARARADDAPASPAAPTPAEPAPVTDPTTEEARAHHRRGLELYDEGDMRLALVELERAYAIGKSFKVLFNIGQVYFQLNDYAKARLTFERYLAEGGSAIAEKRRADVEKDLATLRTRTATLTLRVNVEGAEITIDDASMGKAPLEAAIVNAGKLRVQISKPGFATRTREITLAGGDVQTVDFDLIQTKPDVVVTQTTSGLPGAAIASWIVTGLLAAGTVGTGIAAVAASSKYDSKRETPIAGPPEEARADLERQRSLVRGLALTTDILAVATLAGAGVSLYLTLKPKPQPDAPQVRVQGLGASFSMGF
jgi:tetratricopeptide (TPR) repeat protein